LKGRADDKAMVSYRGEGRGREISDIFKRTKEGALHKGGRKRGASAKGTSTRLFIEGGLLVQSKRGDTTQIIPPQKAEGEKRNGFERFGKGWGGGEEFETKEVRYAKGISSLGKEAAWEKKRCYTKKREWLTIDVKGRVGGGNQEGFPGQKGVHEGGKISPLEGNVEWVSKEGGGSGMEGEGLETRKSLIFSPRLQAGRGTG